MFTSRTPLTICPCCSNKLDAASSADQRSPESGDITVCAYCGTILEFDEKLALTIFTDVESLPEEVKDQLEYISTMIRHKYEATLQ